MNVFLVLIERRDGQDIGMLERSWSSRGIVKRKKKSGKRTVKHWGDPRACLTGTLRKVSNKESGSL